MIIILNKTSPLVSLHVEDMLPCSQQAVWHNCCWDSSVGRTQDSWSKSCEFNPSGSGRKFFFSRVNFLCWLLCSVCSTTVLPQWHIKDLGRSAKSAGGRLHLNMHTPLTQWSQSQLCHCPGIVWEPIRKQAHMQLIREHSVTVFSARRATVDWSWPKEWN